MENRNARLALFDFDGTLTRKDTFFELIKFICGNRAFYKGLLGLSSRLFLYKIKIISHQRAKESVLAWFFKEMPFDIFQNYCDHFAAEVIPHLLRKEALLKLRELKNGGAHIVIVTASLESWVRPWCESIDVVCIASRPETKEGKLTGKLSGKNCQGKEKVNRIRQAMDLSEYKEIYAFGDSKGDLPMLQLATDPYYKPFR